MYYLKSCLLLFFLGSSTFGSVTNPKLWKEPDAWGRVKIAENDIIDGLDCKCPIVEECNKDDSIQLSQIYYKKILNLLFSTENYNEIEDGIYSRTLKLTLNTEQINILKNSKDTRDWDAIVSNVFKNAEHIKFPNLMTSTDNFNWIKINIIDFMLMPEFSFFLYALGFIFLIIFINKTYKYGIVAIFLILCFLSGFAYTYYDCNKQLQIEELAALIHSEGDDPCQNIQAESKSWSWSIWNMFSSKSTKEQCIEYLKKKHKTKLPFCRPDNVFLKYVNEIILDQFQLIVEKCTNIFKTTLEKVPFPYNLVAVVIFGFMLPLFISMLFKHIFDPRVWFHRSSNSNHIHIPTQQSPSVALEKAANELILNKLLLDTNVKLSNLERSISGVQLLNTPEDTQINNSLETCKPNKVVMNITEIIETEKIDNPIDKSCKTENLDKSDEQ